MSVGSFTELFEEVRESCDRRQWSRAVELVREATFLSEKRNSDQWEIRVVRANQVVAPRVHLWPKEVDWRCDCREPEDPCVHIAASLIAEKQGLWQNLTSHATPLAQAGELVYRWHEEKDRLVLQRFINFGSEEILLTESLAGFMAGMQAGRLPSRPVAATKTDFAIDQILKNQRGAVDAKSLLREVIPMLAEVSRHELGGRPLQVVKSSAKIQLSVQKQGANYLVTRASAGVKWESRFVNGPVLSENRIGWDPQQESPWLARLGAGIGRRLSREEIYDFLLTVRNDSGRGVEITYQGWDGPEWVNVVPTVGFQTQTELDVLHVVAELVYGDPVLARTQGGQWRLEHENRWPLRQPSVEQQLVRELHHRLHLSLGQHTKLMGDAAFRCRQALQVWGQASPPASLARLGSAEGASGGDWRLVWGNGGNEAWLIDVEFAPENASPAKSVRWSFSQLQEVLASGRESVFSAELGTWLVLPRVWLQAQIQAVQSLLSLKDGRGQISPGGQIAAANMAEELGLELSPGICRLRDEAMHAAGIHRYALPEDLQAELRPYQNDGFQWLKWRQDRQLGAILADDMGLGKTLQAICVLSHRTLVVAPTSVLSQWRSELHRFRPHLKVNLYHGAHRQWDPSADVVVTSYQLLRQESPLFLAEPWTNLVLDEAQNIKNVRSQVTQVAHKLTGRFRLALSGTPVENRWSELWSLSQFANPGLLGSLSDFAGVVATADGRHSVQHKLRPFVLRRDKATVAQDLPSKTEVVVEVDLSESERQLYESLFLMTKKDFVEKFAQGASVVGLLETLLRVRQACCHPSLIPGQGEVGESSKVQVLIEYLETLLSEGHRALVFSQWTSYLDLIGKALKQNHIPYLRIDGSTLNRSEIVRRFQGGSVESVMLISLKAGGVGLNLTAADYVFIMDPWWNPAVELQAADRAHRIGQQNPVCVYKLIASDTIEKNILALQENKRNLMREVLEGTDAVQSLSKDDLLLLLSKPSE